MEVDNLGITAAKPFDAPTSVNRNVRWVLLNSRAVLLCLNSGKYYGLNPVGTLIWSGLSDNLDKAEICQNIVQQHKIDSLSAMKDYEAFVGELRHIGLIGIQSPKSSLHFFYRFFFLVVRLVPLTLGAWLCQIFVSFLLKSREGLLRICDLAASGKLPSHRSEKQELERCISCFTTAENVSTRAVTLQDCLPRSLSLFIFLIGCGFNVRHTIGVSDTPLRAHAWVEFECEILLDTKDRVRSYVPISSLS